jgi:hypothetical protein
LRKSAEDVGGQIAVRVDNAHPDSGPGAAEHEIEQERGLARAGRAEDREMASERLGREDERAAAGVCYGDPRRRLWLAARAGLRSFATERQLVKAPVGQRPQ